MLLINHMMKLLLPCLSLFTLLGTSASAHAQTEGERRGNPNDGTGYIGIMTLTNSEYLGSADEDTRILPYLSLNNVKGFDLFGPKCFNRDVLSERKFRDTAFAVCELG